jgi:sugar phosphate isomerase/epimerase
MTGQNADQRSSGPRLLVATGPLALLPLDWTLDAIAEAGYDGAELLLAHNPESRNPQRVLQLARRTGLDIPVVHGPYMILLRNVLGQNYREKTRRSIEIVAEIGAEVLVAHAPFRFEPTARRWVVEDASREAAEHGVTFAMENLFPVAGRNFSAVVTPEELLAFPAVVFDTSHFAVAGIDLFEAWEVLADRTVHLHVSDNFGAGRDSHAPIGSGVLPLQRFLNMVGASGWSGTVTLEVDCRAYYDSREGLVAFLRREREKAETLLTGGHIDAPLAVS